MNLLFIAAIIFLVVFVFVSFVTGPEYVHDWGYTRTLSTMIATCAIPILLAVSFTGHAGEQSVVTKPATVTRMGNSIIINSPRFHTLVTKDISFLDAEVVIDEITPRNAYGAELTPFYRARIVDTK